MDKKEKFKMAANILQRELEKCEATSKVNQDTEALLDSEAETIEGGKEDEKEPDQFCGFFCASGTF